MPPNQFLDHPAMKVILQIERRYCRVKPNQESRVIIPSPLDPPKKQSNNDHNHNRKVEHSDPQSFPRERMDYLAFPSTLIALTTRATSPSSSCLNLQISGLYAGLSATSLIVPSPMSYTRLKVLHSSRPPLNWTKQASPSS